MFQLSTPTRRAWLRAAFAASGALLPTLGRTEAAPWRCATGYRADMRRVSYLPDELELADGFPVLDEDFQTNLPGLSIPGFPSLYVLFGPNTNSSGGSIITYLEAQAAYVRQAIELERALGAALAVKPEVEAASDRAVQSRFEGTAWTACDSWYRDDSGRIVTNWPGYMREYLAETRRVDPAAFERVSPR